MRTAMQYFELQSENDTIVLAQKIVADARGGQIITLSGPVGAGKTTFAKAIGAALGIAQTITSPTFTLMSVYELPRTIHGITKLIHIDAYRLESAAELRAAGVEEYLDDPAALILFEWPEKCLEIFSGRTIKKLEFGFEGEQRFCKIKK